jgi:hypothetical protein
MRATLRRTQAASQGVLALSTYTLPFLSRLSISFMYRHHHHDHFTPSTNNSTLVYRYFLWIQPQTHCPFSVPLCLTTILVSRCCSFSIRFCLHNFSFFSFLHHFLCIHYTLRIFLDATLGSLSSGFSLTQHTTIWISLVHPVLSPWSLHAWQLRTAPGSRYPRGHAHTSHTQPRTECFSSISFYFQSQEEPAFPSSWSWLYTFHLTAWHLVFLMLLSF